MSHTGAPTETRSGSALWTLRAAVTVTAALFVLQALTGGEYLVGNAGALDIHGPAAIAIHVVTGLQTLAAALLWRATRGPWWPLGVTAGVFVLSFVQAKLGGGDTLDSHLPLAVLLLVGEMLVLSWAWSRAAR